MFWQVFISGFVLGTISSFHCVGMCGPLALALPMSKYPPLKKILGILLYNFGRVLTYSLLGLLFGLAGRQIFIAGFQQVFSITVGGFILLFFLLSVIRRKANRINVLNKFYIKVQVLVSRSLQISNLSGLFFTGMANGLLPCGMVYLAITGAIATGNTGYGMEFMSAFGFGTIPALLILTFAGFMVSIQARSFIRKLTPYAFLVMGLLLILRGMNLGVPFLSPYFSGISEIVRCR